MIITPEIAESLANVAREIETKYAARRHKNPESASCAEEHDAVQELAANCIQSAEECARWESLIPGAEMHDQENYIMYSSNAGRRAKYWLDQLLDLKV